MKGETFFALLAGAVAGLTIGLLFAPDSGEETRRKVREAAEEGWDKAKEKATELYGQAREETSDALDKLKARGRLARMELKELRDSLTDQAADMKEEARKKLLEQLEKLENALRGDEQSETENV